ncbi:MAG: long-chain-fatty-acid--CoA ligase [Burkholderiaceae bacterium]|nr:long-chain-fatty-acid--CoA ligase [Burkholderiaceae bacterium]
MNLTQPLHKALVERPRAEALLCAGRRSDWAGFVDRVARLAAVLRDLGVQPGDRVGMLGLNSDHYVAFLYATWWAGAVINPVNIRWSAKEIAYSLDDCDTRLLLVDEHFHGATAGLQSLSKSLATLVHWGQGPAPEGALDGPALVAAAAPTDDLGRGGSDLAAVMYTGGTTGRPKGVMLSHANLYCNVLSANLAAQRPAESVGINCAPMFHVGGMALALQLIQRLCRQVILPGFDELPVLEAIAAERGTETFLVPTMLKRLIEHPRFAEFDCSSMQLVLYGAAPIAEALLAAAQAALPAAGFCQLYGMTELSPVVTALPAWCHAPGQPAARLRSVGRPVPIAEVRIVDADDRPLPPGQVGEIVVRGPLVMQGYWGQREQTAQALRGGWMHTGDGGRMDADGFFYVVDRLKDMIVSGGENVYSAEVENAIAQLPQVSLAAVIGVPDERWGERVHAVVVLRPGQALGADALIAHCRTQIAGYKCPRSVEFRDALPITAAGKIQKVELRAPFWAGLSRRVN